MRTTPTSQTEMNTLSSMSSDSLIASAERATLGLELPDWYYGLQHLVYENCSRRPQGLDYLLDRREWKAPRPGVTLRCWKNQLHNIKVAWVPTLDHLGGASPSEFSDALLSDCFHGRNELMWIKSPVVGATRDDRVRHASTALCAALVARFQSIATELQGHFDLRLVGGLVLASGNDGFARGVEAE